MHCIDIYIIFHYILFKKTQKMFPVKHFEVIYKFHSMFLRNLTDKFVNSYISKIWPDNFHQRLTEVTVIPHKDTVMGSNDAILKEAGQTTAVSLVGGHHGPGFVSGHSFGKPPRGPRRAMSISGSGSV
jgi:hypothetical protein